MTEVTSVCFIKEKCCLFHIVVLFYSLLLKVYYSTWLKVYYSTWLKAYYFTQYSSRRFTRDGTIHDLNLQESAKTQTTPVFIKFWNASKLKSQIHSLYSIKFLIKLWAINLIFHG